MRHLFTELVLLPSTLCHNSNWCFLIFAFIVVYTFLHYPKQHVFDVAIKRLSHAVSQQGFLLTGKKKKKKSKYFCISSCLKIIYLKIKH